MTHSSPALQQTLNQGVLTLTLNRPERHHAINHELAEDLIAAVEEAEADEAVGAIVIKGSGRKAFCAGQDMLEASGVEAGAADPLNSSANRAVARLEACPLPLLAAIHGYCFGGGALLAMACDIRYAAPTASFRLPGAEYGLVVGASVLPRLVGVARAKELILTARRFSAEEAQAYGFVNELMPVDELEDRVFRIAETIAGNSRIAVRESKRIMDLASLDRDVCAEEEALNRALRATDEQRERFRTATRKVTGR